MISRMYLVSRDVQTSDAALLTADTASQRVVSHVLLIFGILFIFLLVLVPSMAASSLFLFVVVVDVIVMCCCSALDSGLAVHGFQFCKMAEGAKGSKEGSSNGSCIAS